MRVSEMIALNVSDVSLAGGFVRCIGNGKSRIIPIYPAAIRALTAYVTDIRPNMIAEAGRAGPVRQPERRPHFQTGLLEDHQALSGDGGHRKGHHAPHPTALLCSPPAGERSRPASYSGDAGPCGYLLHTDIHSCHSKAAEGYLQQGSSQSMRDWRRDTSPPVLHPLKGRRHLQCFCAVSETWRFTGGDKYGIIN